MWTRLKKYLSGNLIDVKFRTDYVHYIYQSLLIFLCISFILILYDFLGGLIVASLGASSFIVFASPHKKLAKSRYVIGGYMCGIFTGAIFSALRMLVSDVLQQRGIVLVFFLSGAVALATFLMVVLNFEHPPAAALALGLATDIDYAVTALAALVGVIIICSVRYVLRRHLKDLI